MVTKKTAVRPNFFANLKSLQLNEEAKKAGVTPEEQAYYAMSLSDGWKLFEKDMERLLDELDTMLDVSVSQGLPREQIGENTIVISLAKGVVKRLMQKVEDAKTVCEQPKGK